MGQLELPPGMGGINGILFAGESGWADVNRGSPTTCAEEIAKQLPGPDEVHLHASGSHAGNR